MSVSVLMPVYNGEAYLRDAVNSILQQTYTDFELVIVDDGSQDSTADILSTIVDHRVSVYRNPRNLGLIESLNIGLRVCRGELIARLDSDDVASIDRLHRQVEYMEANPDIDVLGSYYREVGDASKLVKLPRIHKDISEEFLFSCCIAHPTVMIRSRVLTENHIVYPDYRHAEDYGLWVSCIQFATFANIPSVLTYYRVHDSQVSQEYRSEQRRSSDEIRGVYLEKIIGFTPERRHIELHNKISNGDELSYCEYESATDWLIYLDQLGLGHGAAIYLRYCTIYRRGLLRFGPKLMMPYFNGVRRLRFRTLPRNIKFFFVFLRALLFKSFSVIRKCGR